MNNDHKDKVKRWKVATEYFNFDVLCTSKLKRCIATFHHFTSLHEMTVVEMADWVGFVKRKEDRVGRLGN